jgi:SecD/SecF fusion protein
MHNLIRNSIILGVLVLIAVWAILPPDKKLRRGKDLAGGASLVYQVYTRPGEGSDTLGKVIEVIKDRIDPRGVMEISVVAQGSDRIEITMPLPNKRVKDLKQAFEVDLAKFSAATLSPEQFDRIAAMPGEARKAELEKIAAGSVERRERLELAVASHDQLAEAKVHLKAAQSDVNKIDAQMKELAGRGEPADSAIMQGLQTALTAAKAKLSEAVNVVAPLDISYEDTRNASLTGGMPAAEVRRALQLPNAEIKLAAKDGTVHTLPSPRQKALDELRKEFPTETDKLAGAIKTWDAYETERRTLDDPADLVRLLRGAGVLNFRITVDPGTWPGEQEARTQLKAGGPRSVKASEARWYKINKLDGWVHQVEDLQSIEKNGAAAFFGAMGYVVEEYRGEPYMLCWDTRGQRLTEEDGEWALASAGRSQDQLGRPAIAFSMNALGADKLGDLTEKNTGKHMAVLLDDEVYTAPNLKSRISTSGVIEGSFTNAEIDYVTRVLSAGTLRAKLSEEPISQSILGPELGADNLDRGLKSGVVAFFVVSGFMVAYYFGSGFIAVIGLTFNALFLLAMMSLNHAAFTLPGIAGVILAFGMAVDANVLIYERLREEIQHGHDLRTAVRLAYNRAMAPIVDGNLTHLITCLVLGFFGTQEIKGFAVTMSIGVLTTLFCQLFITRLIYTFLIEKVRIRKMTMLPMAVPAVQRAMNLSVDWMRLAPIFYAISVSAVILSFVLIVGGGKQLLDTEFRGGTKVTVQFKHDASGKPITMERAQVEEDLKKAVASDTTGRVKDLAQAEIVAVNPEANGITSNQFTIKSSVTDAKAVLGVVSQAFRDKLDQEEAITFTGSDVKNAAVAPIFAITSPNLAEVIERPGVNEQVSDFVGGAAIVLDDLGPTAPSLKTLEDRLTFMRGDAQFAEASSRSHRIIPIKGTQNAVQSAVIVVRDDAMSYLNDAVNWNNNLRPSEWKLVVEAMNRASTAAAVQSFSPSVAADFAAKAVVAIVLSAVLILIYVGVRFNSVRYSAGALLATLHDCIIATGFIALANFLATKATGIAGPLGIMPFKIDLNVIAAVLTILGYSLNDKIVVMDRIRENRGKLHYASRKLINLSINQTISRTIMTGMTTFLAATVLYIFGGEAIRAFAYCFLIGVVVGTYSSIAIAAPFVWNRKMDRDHHDPSPEGAPAGVVTA